MRGRAHRSRGWSHWGGVPVCTHGETRSGGACVHTHGESRSEAAVWWPRALASVLDSCPSFLGKPGLSLCLPLLSGAPLLPRATCTLHLLLGCWPLGCSRVSLPTWHCGHLEGSGHAGPSALPWRTTGWEVGQGSGVRLCSPRSSCTSAPSPTEVGRLCLGLKMRASLLPAPLLPCTLCHLHAWLAGALVNVPGE